MKSTSFQNGIFAQFLTIFILVTLLTNANKATKKNEAAKLGLIHVKQGPALENQNKNGLRPRRNGLCGRKDLKEKTEKRKS